MPHFSYENLNLVAGFLGTSKRPPLWVLGTGIGRAPGADPIPVPRTHSGALAIWAETRLACQASGRPHETRLATLDVSWWTKPAAAASPHLDSVKVDIVQHLIEPRNVDRRQLVPALPLRTCRV
eukprot:COSAG06_NODE_3637_length_5065_cov_7.899780_5_plen_124_part_00